MSAISLKPAGTYQWDALALGEVMLRFDPGDSRIHSTRTFQVWEAGAEYNVMRGLRRCFGLKTAVVTAMPDNSLGHLLEDLMLQGGVDSSHSLWLPYDGVGRENRLGLNFTERGFGMRGGLGCSDRAHTAISSVKPGQIDWKKIFEKEGVRWFHCGGIYPGLGEKATEVTIEAMKIAKANGTIVSYDINFRPKLWQAIGGAARAQAVNQEIAKYVDVMIGNEGHFPSILGVKVDGIKA
ncbi:MAG: sugar kinase, partial [Verrucomicrobiota bacterium]